LATYKGSSESITYHYVGETASGNTYNATAAPTQAGEYEITARYETATHIGIKSANFAIHRATSTLANIALTGSGIALENLPQNAKVNVYNLQGKRIYSGNSGNSQILKILVQTKGVYIVNATFGSERKTLRVMVK
jgi:hypothetical protein